MNDFMAQFVRLWGLHGLGWIDLVNLLLHFMVLSLLAVGGAITAAPDMQRWLVREQGWLSDEQFTASIAIAQSAPGPNILFVALLGLNAAGFAGLLATLVGIMLPSSLVAWSVGRLGRRRSDSVAMRAFTAGLSPLTLGLLLSTGWILTAPTRTHPGTWVLIALTVVAMLKTRISPMWLIATGAAAGMLGLVG